MDIVTEPIVPTANGTEAADAPVRLELSGLVKEFGKTVAVRGVDLRVRQGTFVTILGPSGSGKTTLLRLIAGFTSPDAGAVIIDGKEVTHRAPAERAIGMVFQNYALFPHMTAADNIAYGLKMRRWSKGERQKRVAAMLEQVGLAELGSRLPRELSGGQQQRVALARALAFQPSILLMDEPLGALDRELRMHMASELRRINTEVGGTTVYVTHDREEALTLADQIAIMHDAEIEALGPPERLFGAPETRFVASFFGGHNVVPTAARRRIDPGHVVAAFAGRDLRVRSSPRAEDGQLAWLSVPERAFGLEPDADTVAIEARVLDTLYLGDAVRATLEIQPDVTVHAVFSISPQRPVIAGAVMTVFLDTGQIVAVSD